MTTTTISHTFNNNHFELTERQLRDLLHYVDIALEQAKNRSVTLKGIKATLIARVSRLEEMEYFAYNLADLLSAFGRFDGLVHVLTTMRNDITITLNGHAESEETHIDLKGLMDEAYKLLSLIQEGYMITISDLLGPKAWKEHGWAREFITRAHNTLELKLIGSGHFAGVFRIANTETVLKIGFKLDDSGAAYAAYCRANPSKHIPKIKALRRFKNCYMVAMPLYETTQEAYMCCELSDELSLQVQYEASYSAVEKGKGAFDADSVLEFILEHHPRYEPVGPKVLSTMYQYDIAKYMLKLMSDAKRIHNYFTGSVWFDLHDDNIMWVNDSTAPGGYRIIITDPMSWNRGKEDPFESGRAWGTGDILQDAREKHLR